MTRIATLHLIQDLLIAFIGSWENKAKPVPAFGRIAITSINELA
jgi:hypothetical protein